MRRPRNIFLIAGEASGDQHASNLALALKKCDPDLRFEGFGGTKMAEAGVHIHQNIVEDLAIIGFVGVLRNLPELRRLFRRVDEIFDTNPPDAVLLVDYPGFNIRVARKAKARGIPVIYYICPQTWAWHESRAVEFPRIFDKMLTIFPFEEPLFREYGADATFVGHPLLDLMKITMSREQVCRHFGLDAGRPIFALLPGSRATEVRGLLPVMLEAAERVLDTIPEAQFILPQAPTISNALLDSILEQFTVEVAVATSFRYNLRAAADFAWVASGTATLETALLLTPMVVVYKTSWLTWMVAKRLVKVPYVALVNIVAGERIVPELLQDEATAQNLADRTLQIMTNPAQLESTRYLLSRVRHRVQFPDGHSAGAQSFSAYDKAAEEFMKALNRLAPCE